MAGACYVCGWVKELHDDSHAFQSACSSCAHPTEWHRDGECRAEELSADDCSCGRKTVIRLHATLSDGGHWFCCGAGERFSYDAAELVDADTLPKLLPLVETYARARIAEELREAATEEGDGFVRGRLNYRADEIEAAR